MDFRHEYIMDGGLYGSREESRTDVYLEVCTVENKERKQTRTYQITFVTGNSTYTLVEVDRDGIKRLCDFPNGLTEEDADAHD